MSFFRNPEVKKSLLLFLSLTALFTLAALLLGCGHWALLAVAGLVFTAAYLLVTYRRYNKIKLLCSELSKLTENKLPAPSANYREGELSILYSEVYKVAGKLNEQVAELAKEKTFLADSLADISHQLRTPLTSLTLISSMLRNPETPPEKRAELIAQLSRLTGSLDNLTEALLKLSRLDAGTAVMSKDSLSVKAIVGKAAEPLAIMLELREQELIYRIGDEHFTGDLLWSVEAVGNILKNCSEHTPCGGTLTVEAEENAVCTELRISDTGSGFKEEDLPHIFERFYRSGPGTGFGIGLALSKMIITRQNGTVKAANRHSGGAEFVIRFYKSVV